MIECHFITVVIKKAVYEAITPSFGHEFRPWETDGQLYHRSAMSPMEVQLLVEPFTQNGAIFKDDAGAARDICVIDFFCGPTLPCDWIEYKMDVIEGSGLYATAEYIPDGQLKHSSAEVPPDEAR